MHRRWLNLDAFLQNAEDEQRLISDDGVHQLMYELKKRSLRYILKGLKPSMSPTSVSIPYDLQLSAVREILVRLSLAHDDWVKAHVQKYISPSSTQQTDITKQSIFKDSTVPELTRLQLTARKLELHIVQVVEKDRSEQATGDLYVNEAGAIRKRLIDNPKGQLKAAVVGSHHAKNVNVVMPPNAFGKAARRKRPNEIEQVHAPESRDILEKPRGKRSCFGDIKDVSLELARPLSWLGMVDGKLGELNEF
jgi:hypothetical protein